MLVTPAAAERLNTDAIIFGVLDTPPFVIHAASGEPDAGIYPELIRLIARSAGLEARIEAMPLSRVAAELASGNVQASITLLNERFSPDVIRVREMGEFEIVAIPRLGVELRSFGDLRGKSIAQLRGAHYDPQIRPETTGETGIELYELSRSNLLPNFVQSGRADAMLGTLVGLQYAIREVGLTAADFGTRLHLNTRKAWLFMSRRARADQTQLDALQHRLELAVDEIQADGSLDLVMKHYTGL